MMPLYTYTVFMPIYIVDIYIIYIYMYYGQASQT